MEDFKLELEELSFGGELMLSLTSSAERTMQRAVYMFLARLHLTRKKENPSVIY